MSVCGLRVAGLVEFMVIGRGAGFMGVRRVQGLGQSGSCKYLQIYMGRYEGMYIYIYNVYIYVYTDIL